MGTKPKPTCREAVVWVRGRLRRENDKRASYAFAPFTGQDWAAFEVWLHLLELFFRSDIEGRQHTLNAMREVLLAMQPSCWGVAKAAIPAVGDWVHEEQIWAALKLARVEAPVEQVLESAEERNERLLLERKSLRVLKGGSS